MSKAKRLQSTPLWREIDGLRYQTVGQLRVKYLEVFGQESRSNHKQFLVRRIAWRLQANAEGDLSERARQQALKLAELGDLRIRAPEAFLRKCSVENPKDPRLPASGTLLTREFQGQSVSVEVLKFGFRYQDRDYKSLSAIARKVTGVQWNGYEFFRLKDGEDRRHAS
jgi:hypothetical protein